MSLRAQDLPTLRMRPASRYQYGTHQHRAALSVFHYPCSRFETRAKQLRTLVQINMHFRYLQASFIVSNHLWYIRSMCYFQVTFGRVSFLNILE